LETIIRSHFSCAGLLQNYGLDSLFSDQIANFKSTTSFEPKIKYKSSFYTFGSSHWWWWEDETYW